MLKFAFNKLLILQLLTSSFPAFGTQTVKIATGDWPPFISDKLKDRGFMAQTIEAAFQKEGLKVEWSFVP